jgi:nucleoid-associated protein YgaU
MKMTVKSFLTFFVLSLLLIVGSLWAQEKMTMEQYNAQLQDYQTREANAKKAADACATECDRIKGEIASTQSQTDAVWNEILTSIGTNQSGVDSYRSDLRSLEAQVNGLLALSPEELLKRRDEIKVVEDKLAELKKNRISALTEMQNSIATIDGKITQAKNKMPKALYDMYNVVVGDYLWKISGKKDIYADPMKWMRIYSYNKDQIKDPDVIYPDQKFKVQRECGPDEYLVAKGDYLAKIAGNANAFSDPAKWTKIFEKNKEVIGEDPNLIFPYTVLIIPK